MSLDLSLFPLNHPRQLRETEVLCVGRLNWDQDYRIFGQLIDMAQYGIAEKPTIRTHAFPPQLWIEFFEEEGTKRENTDPYGEPLTFAYAQDLKKLELPPDASPQSRAIKAFISELPEKTPIVLYWH